MRVIWLQELSPHWCWGWFGWSQVVQGVKNPPAMQEMQKIWVTSLGQEDPHEEGMATHSNILAWKIPWSEKPGGLQSTGLQRIKHGWSNWAGTQLSTHTTEHTQTHVLDSVYGFCFCYQRKNMRGGNWFKKNNQRWLPFPYSPLACPSSTLAWEYNQTCQWKDFKEGKQQRTEMLLSMTLEGCAGEFLQWENPDSQSSVCFSARWAALTLILAMSASQVFLSPFLVLLSLCCWLFSAMKITGSFIQYHLDPSIFQSGKWFPQSQKL